MSTHLAIRRVIFAIRKKGNGTFCQDFDECAVNEHSCPYDSNCVNVSGGYVCHCREGFLGM